MPDIEFVSTALNARYEAAVLLLPSTLGTYRSISLSASLISSDPLIGGSSDGSIGHGFMGLQCVTFLSNIEVSFVKFVLVGCGCVFTSDWFVCKCTSEEGVRSPCPTSICCSPDSFLWSSSTAPGGSSNPDSSEADAEPVGYIEKSTNIKKDMQALYTTIKKQAEGGNFPNLTTFTIYNKSILMNA